MIKESFKKLRDKYVIRQVQRVKFPDFPADRVCRCRVIFSGRVQKVGFRLEMAELAKRLGLTGFCKNQPDGNVLAELQGQENRIYFLISFMESLIRIKITDKHIEELTVRPNETAFIRR